MQQGRHKRIKAPPPIAANTHTGTLKGEQSAYY